MFLYQLPTLDLPDGHSVAEEFPRPLPQGHETRLGPRHEPAQAVPCLARPPRPSVGATLPEQGLAGLGPPGSGSASCGDGLGQVSLSGALMVFDDGSSQRQMGGRIGGLRPDPGLGSGDPLPECVFRASLAPATETADGNRAKVELECLVPVLLLGGPKHERRAALDALTRLIDVEVLRHVMRGAEHLLVDIPPNSAPGKRWLVPRIVAPPGV